MPGFTCWHGVRCPLRIYDIERKSKFSIFDKVRLSAERREQFSSARTDVDVFLQFLINKNFETSFFTFDTNLV